MGSGHILVYAFDVLMQIYISCGYTERTPCKILSDTICGGLTLTREPIRLHISALMMKRKQYDRRFLTPNISPIFPFSEFIHSRKSLAIPKNGIICEAVRKCRYLWFIAWMSPQSGIQILTESFGKFFNLPAEQIQRIWRNYIKFLHKNMILSVPIRHIWGIPA